MSQDRKPGEIIFSIITPTLDADKTIENTIRSVSAQTYPRVEYLVIDGGSRDRTIQIIERNRDVVDYFTSEPDDGLFDAMNKGIRSSKGNVLFFLNGDDCFADPGVLEDVARIFHDDSHPDIVFGNVIWNIAGKRVRTKQSPEVTRLSLAGQTVFHQTVFSKRHVFNVTGPFSTCYKVVSDYEWMLKVFVRHRFKYQYLGRDISIVGTEGKSNTMGFEWERLRLMTQYYGFREIMMHRIWPMRKKYIVGWLKRTSFFTTIEKLAGRGPKC